MVFIVMIERLSKVLQRRSHIRFWHEGDVVFLHRLHEPLGHAVTLWAARCRCVGFQIQFCGELVRAMRRIRRTIGRQLLHRFVRECHSEALLHGSQHHVLHGHAVIATGARSLGLVGHVPVCQRR